MSGILARIEKELDVVEAKIGDKLKVLDQDNDGIISMDEIKAGMTFLHTQLGEEELQVMAGGWGWGAAVLWCCLGGGGFVCNVCTEICTKSTICRKLCGLII